MFPKTSSSKKIFYFQLFGTLTSRTPTSCLFGRGISAGTLCPTVRFHPHSSTWYRDIAPACSSRFSYTQTLVRLFSCPNTWLCRRRIGSSASRFGAGWLTRTPSDADRQGRHNSNWRLRIGQGKTPHRQCISDKPWSTCSRGSTASSCDRRLHHSPEHTFPLRISNPPNTPFYPNKHRFGLIVLSGHILRARRWTTLRPAASVKA